MAPSTITSRPRTTTLSTPLSSQSPFASSQPPIDFWSTRYERHSHGYSQQPQQQQHPPSTSIASQFDENDSAYDLFSTSGGPNSNDELSLGGTYDGGRSGTSPVPRAFSPFGHTGFASSSIVVDDVDLSALAGLSFARTVCRSVRGRPLGTRPGSGGGPRPYTSGGQSASVRSKSKKAQYPAIRTSVFTDPSLNPQQVAGKTDETAVNAEPFVEDVKHWNRENCGWTMQRTRRFEVKKDNDLKGVEDSSVLYEYYEKAKKESRGSPSGDDASRNREENYPGRSDPREAMTYYEVHGGGEPPPLPKGYGRPGRLGDARLFAVDPAETCMLSFKQKEKKNRDLGPGEYLHLSTWDPKVLGGYVPQSRVFASTAERDLFQNASFDPKLGGKSGGPKTYERHPSLVELQGDCIGVVATEPGAVSSPAGKSSAQPTDNGGLSPLRKPPPRTATIVPTASRIRGGGGGSGGGGNVGGGLTFLSGSPSSAVLPSFRRSASAPLIAVDSVRWDLPPASIDGGRRSAGLFDGDPERAFNKVLYRVVKDVRSDAKVSVRVGKGAITTPKAVDLFRNLGDLQIHPDIVGEDEDGNMQVGTVGGGDLPFVKVAGGLKLLERPKTVSKKKTRGGVGAVA